MMISTTEEKWVGVIAEKGDVARKAVCWCLTVVVWGRLAKGSSAHLDGIMRKVQHTQLVSPRQTVSGWRRATHILQCHHMVIDFEVHDMTYMYCTRYLTPHHQGAAKETAAFNCPSRG